MNLNHFLAELAEQNVKLWVEADQLRIRAPKGVLTPQLRDLLTVHKAELILLLSQSDIRANNTEIPLVNVSREQNLPVSFAQERLWFLSQLEPNNPSYNEPVALRLIGFLNIVALEQSLNQIIQRHEVLRTNFVTVDGQPVQVMNNSRTVKVPIVDITTRPESEKAISCQQLIMSVVQQPFDLANDPLIQVTLVKLTDTEHILLLNIHHIIWDAQSADVLVGELATCYTALCNHLSLQLPELPIQYADFAVWQRQWCSGKVLSSQLDYWKQQLQGAPALLELPTDRPRGVSQTFQGAHQKFTLSKQLTEALISFSQRQGVTLFMTLLAAFQTLLYRYTGQTDICIGTPITNRNRPEIEKLIGFFINMLVLRTELSGDLSFADLLYRVRDVALGAYAHQDLPFEKLVEELQPARNLSYTPLFQVGFVLYAPMPQIQMAGLTVSSLAIETATAKFDLSLTLENTDAGLIGQWEYKTDLFDATTITRMVGHFQTLLTAIVTNPEQKLSSLPLLTTAERQQLLVEWNSTQTEYPRQTFIHQLFEEQVERTPNAVAVVCQDTQLTYQELNTKANQLAHYLQKLGVQPEVCTGICVERSLGMVIGLLAILKAGGAYVPLDPNYPSDRLAYMLSDSQISVLLTQNNLVDSLPENKAKIVCLDSDSEIFNTYPHEIPVTRLKPNNLAYVIYTSGSTGKPKGVMIEHQSLVNFTQAAICEHEISKSDTILQFASINFDAANEEIFSGLTTGATLVLRTEEMLNSVSTFVQKCREYKLTVLFLPTAYWQQLISELVRTNQSLPETIRVINIGGERLLPQKFKLWQKYVANTLHPPVLIHGYGPTEATVVATFCNLSQLEPNNWQREVPIGRPIANVQVYILDRNLQPVPIGVPGELYIGGEGVARGYLNNPTLTAEKFIHNPFKEEHQASERLYKTGDLARYLPNGNIEFLGRIDYQVKIRGFRIELGEIEAVLTTHPEVKEAVVIVREDQPSYKHLIAYIVAHEQSKIQNQLRSFLKQKLPDYMIPATFIMLDELPLTPNGKVNRHVLPKPNWEEINSIGNFVPPRTETEQVLANIWSDVLRRKQVGIYDNFFELGGDSIISIQIIAAANQAGLQLTPKQLFQHQTIAELAIVANTTTSISAEQGLVTGEVPLTPIQHWFFEQNWLEPHHFNQSMLFLVPANLNPDLLKQAIEKLLLHHDALRMRFVHSELGWQQINGDSYKSIPFEIVDLSKVPIAKQQEAIETRAAKLQTSLDLSVGQVISLVLFKLGGTSCDRLFIIIHHLVVDGVSWRILLSDLSTAYQQLVNNQNVQLPPKTTSFKEWAIRQENYGRSPALTPELHYWLAPYPADLASLPLDIPGREANTEGSIDQVITYLSKEETRTLLETIPVVYNTMINDVLLTALTQTLTQWTDSRFLLISLEGHGREELFEGVDLSRTVGWFTSVFPVLLELKNTNNLQATLQSIKEQLRLIPNRGIGYGILRYFSQADISKQLQNLPVPEVSFNYLGQFEQLFSESIILGFAPENMGANFSSLANRTYLLDIVGLVADGQLQMTWIYSQNCHRRDTIEYLANQYTESLKMLIGHCQSQEIEKYSSLDVSRTTVSQIPLHLLKLPEDISELLPNNTEEAYPLAKMQEFILHHYSNDSQKMGVYHCQQSFDIYDDNLDVEALKKSLEILVQKHPAFRTVFILKNGSPAFQVVKKNVNFSIVEEDLSNIKSNEQENYIDVVLQQDRYNLFKVENPNEPLFRFWIFRKAKHKIEFLMSFHHAIIDGWSSIEFRNELSELYSQIKKGKEIQVSASANVYKEFVALEQEIIASKDASDFWKFYLRNYTYQPLQPCTASVHTVDVVAEECTLNSEIILGVKKLCRELKVSQKAIFLSAYLDLIVAENKENTVSVGIVTNGRTERLSDPFKAVGLFWNMVPFCQSTIDNKYLQIQNVQNGLIDIEPYVNYPLQQILLEQQKTELFFATFNFLHFHNAKISGDSSSWKITERRYHDKFHFPLNYVVSIDPLEETLTVRLESDQMYFTPDQNRLLIKKYINILKEVIDPE